MQQSTSSGQNATIVFTMQPLQRPKGSSKTLTGSSGTQSLQGRSVGNSETISDSIGDDETIHQRLCIGDDETIHQPMANVSVLLSDSKTGRSSSTVQVRLLRFLAAMNATMIPATVNVNRLATHMPNLKSSSVYSLTVFDVTRCNQNYRLSDSALLIRFSDSNSFNEAVKIHNQQETMRGNPRVVVATSVNPKMVGRTRHWAYTSISTAKVESLSIAELNNFVTTAPSQEIDFVCTGRVTGIKMEKEWCYVSCSNCDKKL
ncbi:hypothetical protein F2Q68_00032493 [Brassica cretica]|uniref:Uncharacterized protein n=1 Tax=Brassica cretica TaxID=69181 RepID=A0A8S9GDZ6_BRACR|nr:hypothetical protein F2Q68_00032493 [Brassica cretica]